MSEDELDAHIVSLGHLAEKAMDEGNPEGARLWTKRMYEAMASRSPEHQARRESEIQRLITEGVDYFQSEHALTLGAKGRPG